MDGWDGKELAAKKGNILKLSFSTILKHLYTVVLLYNNNNGLITVIKLSYVNFCMMELRKRFHLFHKSEVHWIDPIKSWEKSVYKF